MVGWFVGGVRWRGVWAQFGVRGKVEMFFSWCLCGW